MRLNSGSSSCTTCIHRLLAHSTLLCCRNSISLRKAHPGVTAVPSSTTLGFSGSRGEWLHRLQKGCTLRMQLRCALHVPPVWGCGLGLHHLQDVIWRALPFPLPCLQCSLRHSAVACQKRSTLRIAPWQPCCDQCWTAIRIHVDLPWGSSCLEYEAWGVDDCEVGAVCILRSQHDRLCRHSACTHS